MHHPAPAATKINLKYVFIILHNDFVKQEVPIQSHKSITVYEQGFYCAAVVHILLLGHNQSFVALEEEEDLPPASQSSGTWRFSWCQTCLSHGYGSVLYSGLCLPETQLKKNRWGGEKTSQSQNKLLCIWNTVLPVDFSMIATEKLIQLMVPFSSI